MLEFILKYWIEFLFTIVIGALTILFKHYVKLIKNEFKREREDFQKKLTKDTDDKITALKEAFDIEITALVNETQALKHGLLSVQGKLFREECCRLLEHDHVITLDEYRHIEDDHVAYNGLGGNHDGDKLFGLVEFKFEESLRSDD